MATTKQQQQQQQQQQFSTLKLNWCILTCRLNSTSVCYKASTKRKVQHKNTTNTQKHSTRQKQKQYGRKKQYKFFCKGNHFVIYYTKRQQNSF
jgi:Na+/melibiose symporter-like transporter